MIFYDKIAEKYPYLCMLATHPSNSALVRMMLKNIAIN